MVPIFMDKGDKELQSGMAMKNPIKTATKNNRAIIIAIFFVKSILVNASILLSDITASSRVNVVAFHYYFWIILDIKTGISSIPNIHNDFAGTSP